MSQQALDLRRSMQIVRRYKVLVGVVVVLGILAGGAYAVLKPPMLTSTALVALPGLRRPAAWPSQQPSPVQPIPSRQPKRLLRIATRCWLGSTP